MQSKREASQHAYRQAKQELKKRQNALEAASNKVERIEGKGGAGRAKAVAQREGNLANARHERDDAEKHVTEQKAVVEQARKDLFLPQWSTELAPLDPAGSDPPATQP